MSLADSLAIGYDAKITRDKICSASLIHLRNEIHAAYVKQNKNLQKKGNKMLKIEKNKVESNARVYICIAANGSPREITRKFPYTIYLQREQPLA